MTTLRLKTDLSCGSCVEKLKHAFKYEKNISSWDVNLKSPDKILTVQGEVDQPGITKLVEKAGYHILGKLEEEVEQVQSKATEGSPSFVRTYYPLILIFTYILGFTLLKQFIAEAFSFHEVMIDFMGGFFIVFSFFKLLNLRGFTEAYSTYDVLAKRSQTYAYVYPFLELALGVAYLTRFNLVMTSLFTLILMSVSSIGVIRAITKKSQIQCACLGTIFKLPMTYITLFEDLLMASMALLMLSR
ncbi:MAG: cation transporter [Bacteriovoracaceae bacterium]|nr:cation transporter [Bacteriovoracaceae bacterium]